MNSRENIYIKRDAEALVKRVSDHFKVLLITGARQVGKSTLLKKCGAERKYVTLDDPKIRILAIDEPELFIERFSPPVIIDEIQYAPNLFQYIKMEVDRRDENGLYWLTGSQNFSLMQGVTESLAGRVGLINLKTLSRNEILERNNHYFLPTPEYIKNRRELNLKNPSFAEIFSQIWRGSYPQLIRDGELDKDLFYSSYLQTYISRDVRQLVNLGNESDFLKFLRVCASKLGSILNYADLASNTGISVHLARKWISLLITSDIIFLLQPYYNNRLSRAVKSPKIYFSDTGLCSYLASWNTADSLENGAMAGEYFECFVINEIMKSYKNSGLSRNFYYYRDKDKREIDLIIEEGDKIYPIEIKKTKSPKLDMIKNFSLVFSENFTNAALICQCDSDLPMTKNTSTIPINYI